MAPRHGNKLFQEMNAPEDRDLIKDSLKEGLDEWLDKKLDVVGKWTIRGLAALGLAMIAFLLLTANGWGSR